MLNQSTSENQNFPNIHNLSDVQAVLNNFTGEQDISKALGTIMRDYLNAKLFQLKITNLQYETKWGLSFFEFEKQSATWENAGSYELEQEYYAWSEIVSETEHYSKLIKLWN